ncbi:hypothetical protein, partial [Brucella intermedia]|uniref:hypothetical protein n=1 Tax=Brucella intermedia TaxID=94625 RepID=UPI00224A625B
TGRERQPHPPENHVLKSLRAPLAALSEHVHELGCNRRRLYPDIFFHLSAITSADAGANAEFCIAYADFA